MGFDCNLNDLIKKQLLFKLIWRLAQQKSVKEFIEEQLIEREDEIKLNQELHQKKQTKYFKLQQQIQQKILDLEEKIGESEMMQKGTLIQEKKYYDGKIDRLKELIDDNYRKIEIKSLQKTKQQSELADKLNAYNLALEQIDQINYFLNLVLQDETKKGLSFMQMKGKVKTQMENLSKSKLKKVRMDCPMILQLINMGVKNNFEDASTRKQINDMLEALRKFVVNEMNKEGGEQQEQIQKLEKDINTLEEEINKMKQQAMEGAESLNENEETQLELKRSQELWRASLSRFQQEFELVKEQQAIEINTFEEKQMLLKQELEMFEEVWEMLNDLRLVEFISLKQ